MIDIHNHILYDIDDGARNIDDSLDLCRDAFENGYKTIVVTLILQNIIIEIINKLTHATHKS